MTDFSVYLTSIGNDNYHLFVKNNQSEADFIRIIIGSTEIVGGERVGRVANSWIISPLKSSGEHVFIQQVNKRAVLGKRPWVAFETVKRSKPRNITIGCFVAISQPASKWRKTIGSSTHFDIKAIDSIKVLEKQNSPSLARISRAIPALIIP